MISRTAKRLFSGRDIHEKHRTATPLELFYDLIFVVAIANISVALHHGFAANHIVQSIISFMMVFMAIWWAWNQFTWFASSFDNDGVLFRLATFWQMIGALVLAAGVEKAFNGDYIIVTIGYVIIRSSSILMWWKVSRDNPHLKITARRYAVGISLCQIGWITQNFFPFHYWVFIALWLSEFFVPYYAESHTPTHFHAEHIEERFGLLTIIVLGESILAATHSFSKLIDHFSYDMLFVAIGCVLTLFGMWWLYFNNSVEHKLCEKKHAFQWGYGHVVIFASAAAVGALIGVNVDVLTHHGDITLSVANLGFALAVAIYLCGLWFCQERLLGKGKGRSYLMLIIAICVVVLGFLPHTIFTVGTLIITTVIYRQYKPLMKA